MIEQPEHIDDYPEYHNETIVINDSVNQFLFNLLTLSLLSISIIAVCCRSAPSIITRINNTRHISNLTEYILRSETDEELNITIEPCPICIESYLPKQKVITLPCSHKFHSHCIRGWLETELTCPMCRHSVII